MTGHREGDGQDVGYTLHFYPSPNSLKVIILLNELGLEWRARKVDLAGGEQLSAEFAALNPNRKVPVLQLQSGAAIFESGAILEFLAEQHGGFLSAVSEERWLCKQWLYWQMSALGPAAGQAHHFRRFAPERIPYGIRRYTDEVNRLYGVMNEHLGSRKWLANSYSIADMACWPWLVHADWQGQALSEFPALEDWYEAVALRPAVKSALAAYPTAEIASEDYAVLLNQTAEGLDNS